MINKKLVITNQSAKVALNKSKSLVDLTNTILDNKYSGSKFQFYLPIETDLARIQRRAIDSLEPISITTYNTFAKKMALLCFVMRLQKLKYSSKKALIIVESEFLRFVLKEKVHNNDCICSIKEVRDKLNDEILVCDDYDTQTFLYLRDRSDCLSLINNDEISRMYFSNNNRFEFDEIFLPVYEIYRFAIQFVPNNDRANDVTLLQRLQRKNSGSDKPFVWIENDLSGILESIVLIIDENPIDNIGIILPYVSDIENHNLSVEKYYKSISKEYACSKYYDGIKLKKLYNIVITTYDDAKLIDFHIVILPQFDKVKEIVDYETIFNTICSAENQLHIFQENYDEEYDDLVEIIDNRNKPI